MYNMDGTMRAGLKGDPGDIYQDTNVKDDIRKIMNIQTNRTYYISVRAMGGDDTPIDSDESAKFAVRF